VQGRTESADLGSEGPGVIRADLDRDPTRFVRGADPQAGAEHAPEHPQDRGVGPAMGPDRVAPTGWVATLLLLQTRGQVTAAEVAAEVAAELEVSERTAVP